MSENSKGTLEKIFLAGVGALAMTGEKTKEVLDDLVKRGELTVEQGKVLNEELSRNIKSSLAKEESDERLAHMLQNIDKLSEEDREQLKAKLAEFDKSPAGE